jgi:hypothetical protein
VTALVRSTEEDRVDDLAAYARKPIDDAKSQWQKDLEAPAAWAKKGETATVPIERAMAIVVKQISENPASATPPQPPSDAGADADAAAAAEDGGMAEEGGAESTDGGTTGEAADAGTQLADAAPEVTDAAPKKAPKPKLAPPPGGGAAPPPPPPEPPPEAP